MSQQREKHCVNKHTLPTMVAMVMMRGAMGMVMLRPILLLAIPSAMMVTMVMAVIHFGVMFTMVMFPSAGVMVAMVTPVITSHMMAVTRQASIAMAMGTMLNKVKIGKCHNHFY